MTQRIHNPRPTMTPQIAHALATDAGNRSMRAAGRKVWSQEDLNAAAREYDRAFPPPKNPHGKYSAYVKGVGRPDFFLLATGTKAQVKKYARAWKRAADDFVTNMKGQSGVTADNEVQIRESNPGESRARFRHEDVSAVPAGWRVITVSHGDHRIRVAYPKRKKNKIGGVDGRLISILHPMKENPAEGCKARSMNPAELVVLGANPPRRRSAMKYQVVSFKKNDNSIFTKDFDAKDEARKFSKGEYKKNRALDPQFYFRPRIRRVPAGPQSNPGELVLMGANPGYPKDYLEKQAAALKALYDAHRSQGISHEVALDRVVKDSSVDSKAIEIFLSKIRRANPSEAEAADKLFAEFQGRPSEQIHVTDEPHMPAGDYAQLARLVELGIEPNGHGTVVPLEFSRKDGVIIAAAPGSEQIYFVGGNQDITEILDEFEVNADIAAQPEVRLGRVRTIAYRAAKAQTGFTPSDYEHSFGEEGGELPEAIFDTRHKRILLKGGSYRIEAPGIIN